MISGESGPQVGTNATTSVSDSIATSFIKLSLVYFLIGAVWMGLGPWLPEPWSGGTYETSMATSVYDTVRVHVMVIGWASFALIGAIYYLVPRLAGKSLRSVRLGRVHFWITAAVVPLAFVAEGYATFVIGSLMQSGKTPDQAIASAAIAPYLLVYLTAYLIGLVVQFLFVYNIYRTVRR